MPQKELKKGQVYHILSANKKDFPNYIEEAEYVRKEKFRNGKEWHTFYNILGGIEMDSSEGPVIMNGIIRRIRIPVKSVIMNDILSTLKCGVS